MRIEFHLEGPRTVAWFQTAINGYHEALVADREEADKRWLAAHPHVSPGQLDPDGNSPSTEAPAPVEAEKPKATRSRKAKDEPAPTTQEEPAQITTSPEDRKPVEEIEEAEVVDVFEEAAPAKVYTRDDVKAAMQTYVAKHGMDALAKNAETMLGAPKLSAIPEDAAAFEAAVKRLEAAVA